MPRFIFKQEVAVHGDDPTDAYRKLFRHMHASEFDDLLREAYVVDDHDVRRAVPFGEMEAAIETVVSEVV